MAGSSLNSDSESWFPSGEDEDFQYEPLDLNRAEIRLVRICHVHGDQVECEVERWDLKTCPPYKALSYCWGSRDRLRRIYLNSGAFTVRENLWQFLLTSASREAQAEVGPLGQYFWIDQICVDQANTDEKNHQVQQMAAIFRGARQVVAWLGPEANGSDLVVQYLHRLGQVPRTIRTSVSVRPHLQSHLRMDPSFDLPAVPLRNVSAFFVRPYWTRLWVLQEVGLARDLIWLCGTVAVEYDYLHRAALELNVFFQRQEKNPIGKTLLGWAQVPDFTLIRSFRHCFQGPLQRGVLDHQIFGFSHFKCSDPRDKVFGLLALFDPDGVISIDYGKKPADVFWDVLANYRPLGLEPRWQVALLADAMGVTGLEPVSRGTDMISALSNFQRLFPEYSREEVFSAKSLSLAKMYQDRGYDERLQVRYW